MISNKCLKSPHTKPNIGFVIDTFEGFILMSFYKAGLPATVK